MTTTIAISGKGGSGKTTIAAMIMRYLVEQEKGGAVLAVDADPNSCLGLTLGVEPGGTVSDIRESAISKSPSNQVQDKLRTVEYGIQQAITEAGGFDLLTMGRPEGPGCYCAVNNMLRKFLDKLSGQYHYIVIDNEAGMEHLSRRTTNNVDLLLIAAEPTPVGITTARRILELSEKLPIIVKKTGIIWNKMVKMKIPDLAYRRSGGDINIECVKTNVANQVKTIQNEEKTALNEVENLACIPYDNDVVEKSAQGENIFGLDENNPAFLEVVNMLKRTLHSA
jgi:CO dehydrogenase maturation factor